MAYQHHPQAPTPSRAKGASLATRAAFGLLVGAVIAGGAWYLLLGRFEAEPVLAASRLEPDQPSPMADTRNEPVRVSARRQGETVRGTLTLPESSNRLLNASDLASLTPEQLGAARSEILARHGGSADQRSLAGGEGTPLSDIEAANLRLIDETAKAR